MHSLLKSYSSGKNKCIRKFKKKKQERKPKICCCFNAIWLKGETFNNQHVHVNTNKDNKK